MRTATTVQGKASRPTFSMPVPQGLVQRACSCGGKADGECEACRRRRSPGDAAGFGHSFAGVRVHSGGQSVSLAGAAPGSQPPTPAAPRQQPSDKRPEVFDLPKGDAKKAGSKRRAGKRAACVVPNSFAMTFSELQNDATAAQGLMEIRFEGEGKTKFPGHVEQPFAFGPRRFDQGGKLCSCDCLRYRQFIAATAFQKPAGQSAFIPIPEITSGHIKLPADRKWHEEDTSTIAKSFLGCGRHYEDHPGIFGGAASGIGALIRINFLLQIWDQCQQKSVKESRQTLTIGGDAPPRVIRWDPGWKELKLTDIAKELHQRQPAQGTTQPSSLQSPPLLSPPLPFDLNVPSLL